MDFDFFFWSLHNFIVAAIASSIYIIGILVSDEKHSYFFYQKVLCGKYLQHNPSFHHQEGNWSILGNGCFSSSTPKYYGIFTPSFARLFTDSVYRGRLHDGILRCVFFWCCWKNSNTRWPEYFFFIFWLLAKFKTWNKEFIFKSQASGVFFCCCW
jgi:hypothetical protein